MELHDIPTGAVVLGVDGSAHADQAASWAARHADLESRDLVLVHAVAGTSTAVAWMAEGGVDPTPYLAQADAAGQELLDAAAAKIREDHPELRLHTVVSRADARSALLEAATHASTVVLGSHGRGPVATLLLGSVSATVAAHATCPVVVVRPHHPGKVRRGVLVGADGTETSPQVLEFAFRQAAELGLPLTVVHTVWDALAVAADPREITPDDVEYERASLALAESLAGLTEKFPEVSVRKTLVRGTAASGLLALADDMDLVVVGHHRKDPINRVLLGSSAIGVLEHASTVVAVVPQH